MTDAAPSGRGGHRRRLHEAAWPDMFANLQTAYAELTRARLDLERRTAEIGEARDLFQRVVVSMSEALFLTDRGGRILQTNPAARAMLERSEDELIGLPLEVACGTADLPTTPWKLLERSPTGVVQELAAEVRTASGRAVPVSASCGLVRDKSSKVVGLVVVLRDVTERKRAEEAQRFLAEASHVLTASLDHETTLTTLARLAVPFLADWCTVDVVTADGSLLRLASACADPRKASLLEELRRRFPRPEDEDAIVLALRSGRPALYPAGIDPPSPRDRVRRRVHRALGTQSTMVVPLVARGRTLGVLTLAAAESGRRFGPADLTLADDLARRAGLAIDNARLYREAQEAIRARDDFVSSAAHDFKTPLTVLLNRAQLIERRAARKADAPVDHAALRQIIAEARRMRSMVDELLDVTRAEHGRLTSERVPMNLADMARQACDRFSSRRHGCILDAPEPVFVLGDRTRISQLLDNLVDNAVKYSPAGGDVLIRTWLEGEAALLTIADQGIGIPAEDLPHIFERFHRAGNVDHRRFTGLGLGLYICRKIVEEHGGGIVAESAGPGQGSTFRVTLPASLANIGGSRDA